MKLLGCRKGGGRFGNRKGAEGRPKLDAFRQTFLWMTLFYFSINEHANQMKKCIIYIMYNIYSIFQVIFFFFFFWIKTSEEAESHILPVLDSPVKTMRQKSSRAESFLIDQYSRHQHACLINTHYCPANGIKAVFTLTRRMLLQHIVNQDTT